VSVQDDGPGIPDAILGHIFDPFFSTRTDGHGLGLASSLHILQQHGGHLAADSVSEGGARFRLWLPVAAPDEDVPPPVPITQSAVRTRRVLLVDDEPAVLRVLTRLLSRVGAEVTAIANGADAVTRTLEAAAEGRPFEAALLDLTIPGGLGGREVAPQLRDIAPHMTLIAMSGHSVDPVLLQPRSYGFDAALPKPFPMDDVEALLATLLDAPSPSEDR
jgi:CheY-like chemotaxis protein